jgi:hypothetical protein
MTNNNDTQNCPSPPSALATALFGWHPEIQRSARAHAACQVELAKFRKAGFTGPRDPAYRRAKAELKRRRQAEKERADAAQCDICARQWTQSHGGRAYAPDVETDDYQHIDYTCPACSHDTRRIEDRSFDF